MNYITTVLLRGMAGQQFTLSAFSKNTTFGGFPAVYVFVRMVADFLGNNVDEVCYVGQTENLASVQSDPYMWANLERYTRHRVCVPGCLRSAAVLPGVRVGVRTSSHEMCRRAL